MLNVCALGIGSGPDLAGRDDPWAWFRQAFFALVSAAFLVRRKARKPTPAKPARSIAPDDGSGMGVVTTKTEPRMSLMSSPKLTSTN